MLKKLTKHGNSLALVSDRPILDLLKIDKETALDISADGKRLIVAPGHASERRKRFDATQKWAHKRAITYLPTPDRSGTVSTA